MTIRALCTIAVVTIVSGRTTQNFDLGWKFILGDEPGNPINQCTVVYPINLNGIQCFGLSSAGNQSSAKDCEAAACGASLNLWQWCDPAGSCNGPPSSCWIGQLTPSMQCQPSAGWISNTTNATFPYPPPPPPPPVCPGDRACVNYDDSSWRNVNTPHDFVDEGTPDANADRNHGYLPFNISYYRKHFTIPAAWSGQPVWLDFDGVYRASDYWLNGVWIGHHESGYTPNRWYIHNATNSTLNYGAENVLAIRVDAQSFQEGWFYEGGGIYRHVTLNTAPSINIVPWSLYAPSVITGTISSPQGSAGPQTATAALVTINVEVQSSGSKADTWTLSSTIYDASGVAVGSAQDSGAALPPGGWVKSTKQATLQNVNLWNVAAPYLYTVSSTLTSGSGTVDIVNITIGVRNAYFDANHGFVLNGIPTKVQGFSQHQDFAGVGTAVPDRANRYRVDSLKAIGANGWRTAHNPVNSELLDYMDRAGMLVWSENRNLERQVIGSPRHASGASSTTRHLLAAVGRTVTISGNYGQVIDTSTFPSPMYLSDAAAMVLRDRNHPCIIIWSLCNEGGCMQSDPLGGIVASAFKNTILDIDGSRPITANSEDYPGDTLTRITDVEAFSYNYGEYDGSHQRYPWKPVIGGESASCVSDRSYYGPTNATSGHVTADDIGCVVEAWQSAATREWVAGNFAWTGTDYKGEPSPLNWPDINSHFGVVDICGFPKDSAGYYRAWWISGSQTVSLLPASWNNPVAPGQTLSVIAFSAGATVELFVNGVTQGTQNVTAFGAVTFNGVVYQPGTVNATSYDASGAYFGSVSISTTGPAVALRVSCDAGSDTITADGQDVSLVRVEVIDASGNVVLDASPVLTYTATGAGAIYGVGNGDPADHTPDKVGYPDLPYGGVWTRAAFNGLARAVVQSTTTPGSITVTVTSPGLTSGSTTITTV